MTDEDGNSLHLTRLIELKAWAQDMRLPPERLTFHVLEAPDVAEALAGWVR